MGHTRAIEMRRYAGNEDGLRWHLGHNHYPPVSTDFIPAAKEAIVRANDDDWASEITLPNGRTATVEEVVNTLHLDAFLGPEAQDCEDDIPFGDPIIG